MDDDARNIGMLCYVAQRPPSRNTTLTEQERVLHWKCMYLNPGMVNWKCKYLASGPVDCNCMCLS